MTQSDQHNQTPSQNQQATPKKKTSKLKWFFWVTLFLGLLVTPLVAVIIYAMTIYPTLPDASSLKEVTYQVPLKIVTEDDKLISEIGTEKRIPLDYTQIPERMTQAITASEDESFFEHGGVDYTGLARAVFELVTTGSKKSGGSTITMQVARNFFLTKEKTYLRKLNEIILSYKIENELTKQEILALYLNKIFLGHRSYGVAAAAQTYYGKPLDELSIDEYAMIAGLPKAPSLYNPVTNPERAKLRRNYVLRRMFEQNYITRQEMEDYQAVEVHAKLVGARIDIEAGYVAEMARGFALENFGEEALKLGLTIVTTLDSNLQEAANLAVRNGLQEYERRHGYRGPIQQFTEEEMQDTEQILDTLNRIGKFGGLLVGVVTEFKGADTQVMTLHGETITLPFEDMKWAQPYFNVNSKGPVPKKQQDVLKVGDAIFLQHLDGRWQLAQDPKTEAALVSIKPQNGQILALVGGFDYFRSKFNRVTQAERQVGSNFKPFLYAAAIDKGLTAATIINDAPVVFHDRALEDIWRPENYSGRFYGPTRLRQALAYSRNLVSIRLLQEIGVKYAIDYVQNFGFGEYEMNKHRNLSLALGSAEFTPLDVVQGYATFANTGYKIKPYIIKEVRDYSGEVIYRAEPKTACQSQCMEDDPTSAERAISPQTAYITTSMMQDVINYGSGRQAKALNRQDIAGKTGTTNDQKDAWFSGFSPDIATSVWAGFDQPSTLGRSEVGGRAALPIWINYMRVALAPYSNAPFARPEGLVNIPINKNTGEAVPANTPGAIFEVFDENNAPTLRRFHENKIHEMTEELFQ